MSVASPDISAAAEPTSSASDNSAEHDPPGLKALDRFLWLVAKDVDGDAVLDLKFSAEESARLHELERLDRAGTLPQSDELELQAFRDVEHFSAILKATVDQVRNGWTGPAA